MKLRFLFIFSLSIFFTLPSYSQDTNSAKFFPLAVGNKWIYIRHFTFYPPDSVKVEITKDSVINNHKYFYQSFYGGWIRYDSLSGNLLILSENGGCSIFSNDRIIDSLPSMPGNIVQCQYQATFTRECTDTGNINLFGNYYTQSKEFEHDGLVYGIVRYAKNFGVYYSCSGEPPPCSGYSILKGCVINGVVYGDTTLTNIKRVSNTVPENFSLSQNFPNPFNPITTINYSIPTTQYTILKVYGALGIEVATLVNEKQPAGSYEVEFDGSNLPSAIYFYELITDNFSEVKRMILLK